MEPSEQRAHDRTDRALTGRRGTLRVCVGLIGSLAVVALGAPAVAHTHVDDGFVALDSPIQDPASLRELGGEQLTIFEGDQTPSDKSVAALTRDGTPVIVRSLYGEPRATAPEPTKDAAPTEWVEGVNYFADERPQESTTELSFDQLPQVAPESLRLEITTATTATSFSAAWADGSKVPYEVARDGRVIGASTDGTFLETGLSPSTEYLFTASPTSEGSRALTHTFAVKTLPPNAEDIIRARSGAVANLASSTSSSWFMYNTFITDKHIYWDPAQWGGGCAIGVGESFGGDDRDFVTPGLYVDPWVVNSMKTGARVKIGWGGPGYITMQKQVNPTRLYDTSHALKDTRTAGTDGIVFQNPHVSGGNYLSLGISHEVGNPFCAVGAIRYSLPTVKIWKNGTMSASGSRQPVPAHEAYGLFSNSSGTQYWHPLYRGQQGDFWCLGGLCPSQNIDISYTPH